MARLRARLLLGGQLAPAHHAPLAAVARQRDGAAVLPLRAEAVRHLLRAERADARAGRRRRRRRRRGEGGDRHAAEVSQAGDTHRRVVEAQTRLDEPFHFHFDVDLLYFDVRIRRYQNTLKI